MVLLTLNFVLLRMRGKGFRFGNVPPTMLLLMGGGLLILVLVIVLVIKSVNSTESDSTSMTLPPPPTRVPSPVVYSPQPSPSPSPIVYSPRPPPSPSPIVYSPRPPPSPSPVVYSPPPPSPSPSPVVYSPQPPPPAPVVYAPPPPPPAPIVYAEGTVGDILNVQSMQLPNKDIITTEDPVNMYPDVGPKEPGGCNFNSKWGMTVSGYGYNNATGSCVRCNGGGVFNGITCITCNDYTKYWDLTSKSCKSGTSCPPGQVFNTNTNFGPIGCMEMSFAG